MKNHVVIAFISFLLFVFEMHFSTIHITIYFFSCFASFVPCLVNVHAVVQAEVATQVEQETGSRNLKDQVLQPQRCRNHGYKNVVDWKPRFIVLSKIKPGFQFIELMNQQLLS